MVFLCIPSAAAPVLPPARKGARTNDRSCRAPGQHEIKGPKGTPGGHEQKTALASHQTRPHRGQRGRRKENTQPRSGPIAALSGPMAVDCELWRMSLIMAPKVPVFARIWHSRGVIKSHAARHGRSALSSVQLGSILTAAWLLLWQLRPCKQAAGITTRACERERSHSRAACFLLFIACLVSSHALQPIASPITVPVG